MTLKESKISVITLTLGRPSLRDVAKDLNNQTLKPKEWLIVADGSDAASDASKRIKVYKGKARIIIARERMPLDYPKWFHVVPHITTPYVALMDDDNRFHTPHLLELQHALEQGVRFAATSRSYCDKDLVPRAKEHPLSELVDNNCMGVEVSLLAEASDFWNSTPERGRFADIEFQSYLRARGIHFYRIQDAYTVNYKLNEKYHSASALTGELVFETLHGQVVRVYSQES